MNIDWQKNLLGPVLVGTLIGALVGAVSVYWNSPVANLLGLTLDLLLKATRRLLGTGAARDLSSPQGLVLLCTFYSAFLSVVFHLISTVFKKLVPASRGWLSPVSLLVWELAVFILLFHLMLWLHATKYLPYTNILSQRGIFIAIVCFLAVAVVVSLVFTLTRFLVKPCAARFGRLLIPGTVSILLLFLGGLSVSAVKKATSATEIAQFEKRETGIRVVLLGVDAVTGSILDGLLERGKLPNISRLIKSGSSGNLRSSMPLKSPVLWTTIATGKTPDKHGVQDFLVKRPGKTESIPVTSINRTTVALWNIVGTWDEAGVVNWWASWPAEKIHGFIVSDRFHFPKVKARCSPPEITTAVDSLMEAGPDDCELARFTDYRPGETFEPVLSSLLRYSPSDFLWNTLCKTYRADGLVFRTSRFMARPRSPRLFCVYSFGIDAIQHHFYRYHPLYTRFPYSLFDSQRDEDFTGAVIDSYYELTDSRLGDYIEEADDSTVVILVSDHGSGPLLRQVTALDVNKYFVLKGWLTRDERGDIDMEKTLVYCSGSQLMESTRKLYFGDRIKTDPDSLTAFKKTLVDEMRRLTTTGGDRLVTGVTREEGHSADVIVRINLWIDASDSIYVNGAKRALTDIAVPMSEVLSGEHRINGVMLAAGGPVKQGGRIHGASILDIAPTVLYLLGYPTAGDMDGRVLTEIIEESFLEKHPVRLIPSYDEITKRSWIEVEGGDDAVEKVLENLRALGYIN